MLCALIMAGGKGTRFWPLSTEQKPKQFLNLVGDKSMIQMTVDRITKLIPLEKVFICTGAEYVDLLKEQLPELDERNIIIEPEGRNTTACIALSGLIIKKFYKDATMVVLPADHLIKNETSFLNIISNAHQFINKNNDSIVTIGIQPSRPETGFGYIKLDRMNKPNKFEEIYKVDSFTEKPKLEVAEYYLQTGDYLWNSGMFIWKVDFILKQIETYSPSTYEALKNILNIKDEDLQEYINSAYSRVESISIDYSVLEKSNSIYVIPGDIGWDDIGTWNSVERYKSKDENSNISDGSNILINTVGSTIISTEKKIIIKDMKDIFVVESDDTIIITKRDNISDISLLKNSIVEDCTNA